MFQSSLQEYLITIFNTNSQGLKAKGEYLYDVDLSGNFVINEQISGTYRTEEIEFLPAQVIEWRNTPQPYKRIDLQDLALPFRISCREEQLDDCLLAIENFRTTLNGSNTTIDGLNVGFRIAQPNVIVPIGADNGNDWIPIDITVMLSAGANLLYGNAPISNFKMARNGQSLVELVASQIDITTSTESNPKNVQGDTKISSNSRTLQLTVTVFYEDNVSLCNDFIDWLWTDLGTNQQYDISIKYTDTITKTETVVITNIQQSLQYGVPVGFVMTLYKAI